MSTDLRSFLEEEPAALAPYAALLELGDEGLDRPTAADSPAHGWSGRDVLGHVAAWVEHALAVARELAATGESPTRTEMDARWDAGEGDAVNDELLAAWRSLPMDEVRRRFTATPEALGATLAGVRGGRWTGDPDLLDFFRSETIEHYAEHLPDLAEVLRQAGR